MKNEKVNLDGQIVQADQFPVAPGATDALGWSFDIFGSYSMHAKKRQLLDLEQQGNVPNTIHHYDIPKTVSIGSGHSFSGKADYCKTTESIRKYFQAKASVSGSYGAFKGSVSANYSNSQVNDSLNEYAIYDGSLDAYTLQIENPNIDLLAQSVKTDPDYHAFIAAAKEGFREKNPSAFFTFFSKYGTHFLHQVDMGGRLYYYSSVKKTSDMSSTDISVQVEAEYNAVFYSAKGSASAAWKNVSETWSENRTVHMEVLGGDTTDMAQALVLSRGCNFNESYTNWVKSIVKNPSPVGFELLPIAALFSGPEAEAISEAYHAYAGSRLRASLTFKRAGLSLQGVQEKLPYVPVPDIGGAGASIVPFGSVMVIIDRSTGLVVQDIALKDGSLPDKIKQYQGNKRYIALLYWTSAVGNIPGSGGISSMVTPDQELAEFIQSAGAGAKFDTLMSLNASSAYPSYVHNVYLLAGVIGSYETGFESYNYTDNDASSSPVASLDLLFLPQDTGNGLKFFLSQI